MTIPTPADILDVPMGENDAQAATIRDYLIELLATLWREGETFSGKHPFGNDGWTDELDTALGRAGLVEATFYEDGGLEDIDRERADVLIHAAIRALGKSPEPKGQSSGRRRLAAVELAVKAMEEVPYYPTEGKVKYETVFAAAEDYGRAIVTMATAFVTFVEGEGE